MYLSPINSPPYFKERLLNFAFGMRFSPASLVCFWQTLTHVCVLKVRLHGQVTLVDLQDGVCAWKKRINFRKGGDNGRNSLVSISLPLVYCSFHKKLLFNRLTSYLEVRRHNVRFWRNGGRNFAESETCVHEGVTRRTRGENRRYAKPLVVLSKWGRRAA